MSKRDETTGAFAVAIALGIVVLILWGMVDSKNEEISRLKSNFGYLAKESVQQDDDIQSLQARLAKAPDREDRAYAKGYRVGQIYICNTLYGGKPFPDGWSLDLASPDGYPLHKAIVLVWYADAPNEVPYRITKKMCMANARA